MSPIIQRPSDLRWYCCCQENREQHLPLEGVFQVKVSRQISSHLRRQQILLFSSDEGDEDHQLVCMNHSFDCNCFFYLKLPSLSWTTFLRQEVECKLTHLKGKLTAVQSSSHFESSWVTWPPFVRFMRRCLVSDVVTWRRIIVPKQREWHAERHLKEEAEDHSVE